MKLIAQKDNKTFVAEITTKELRLLHNKCYGSDFVKKNVFVGAELDMTEAYNFKKDLMEALEKHKQFIESNRTIIKALNKGFLKLCKLGEKNG